MNLPTIPSNFSSGEVLSADRLNQILDWMRRVNELLPGLEISGGPGMRVSKSSAGTVISVDGGGNGAEFVPPHPFHVRVLYKGTSATGIAVTGGGVYVSLFKLEAYDTANSPVATDDSDESVAPRYSLRMTGVNSEYKKSEIIDGNPVGKTLYLKRDFWGTTTFELGGGSENEDDGNGDDGEDGGEDGGNPYIDPPALVKIAEFKESNGVILVNQFLRSDIFISQGDPKC